jgi:hypothetical protein
MTQRGKSMMYASSVTNTYHLPRLTFPPTIKTSFEYYNHVSKNNVAIKLCTCSFVQIHGFADVLEDQKSLAGPDAGKYLVANYSVLEEDVILGPYTYDVNLFPPNKTVFHPCTVWAPSNATHYEVQMYPVVDDQLDLASPFCTINPWRADVSAPFKYANHLYDANNCQLTQMTHSEHDGGCGGERVFVISTRPFQVGSEIGISYGNDRGVAAFLEKEINFKLRYEQQTVKTKACTDGFITYGEFLSCDPVPAGKMVLDFKKCSFKFGKPVQKVKMSFKKDVVKPKVRMVKLKVPVEEEEETFMGEMDCHTLFPELYGF